MVRLSLLSAALLLGAALLSPTPAPAAGADPLLLEVICHFETRGERRPDFAVSGDGRDWGQCQVHYWSARMVGFPATRNPGDLFIPEVNRKYAERILRHCAGKYAERGLKATAPRLAYCYNEGRVAGNPPATPYVKQVAHDYAMLRLERLVTGRPGTASLARLQR